MQPRGQEGGRTGEWEGGGEERKCFFGESVFLERVFVFGESVFFLERVFFWRESLLCPKWGRE
jgi:hypothetical protein